MSDQTNPSASPSLPHDLEAEVTNRVRDHLALPVAAEPADGGDPHVVGAAPRGAGAAILALLPTVLRIVLDVLRERGVIPADGGDPATP